MLPLDYEADIRLKCLQIATNTIGINNGDEHIKAARAMADFVLGTSDTEIICAAREFAKKVKN